MKPNVKYLLYYIKETIRQTLKEYEYYVDKDGWAHDDEGNKWFVGSEKKHFGRPHDETYGLDKLNRPKLKKDSSGYKKNKRMW